MWDEKHLQLLRQGPQVWNNWRQSNVDIAPELTGIALALNERRWGPEQGGPINFKQAKLGSVNLSYAALPGANFEFAILDRCDLTGSRLVGAKFRGASLRDVHFAAADLQQADFTDADLRGADFRGALHLHAGQIQGARGDLHTQLPEYIIPPISWRQAERTAGKVFPGSQSQTAQTASDIPNVGTTSLPRNKSISMIAMAAAGLVVIGGVVAVQFVLNRSPSKTSQAASKSVEITTAAAQRRQNTKQRTVATSPQPIIPKSSEEAAWALVQREPTHDILHDYLVTFPHGKHARNVQKQYDRLEARKARQRAEIAVARADVTAWAKVKLNPTHNSLHNYLVKFPDGKYVVEAQAKYDLLEKREAQQRAKIAQSQAEAGAWAKVRSNPTRAALEAYLSSYADGEFAGVARDQIARLNKLKRNAAQAPNEAGGEQFSTGTIRQPKDPIANKLLSIRREGTDNLQKVQVIPAFKGPLTVRPLGSTPAGLPSRRGAGADNQPVADSAEEQAKWRLVQQRPTQLGLRSFIVKFPKSPNVKIAKFQLAALGAEFAKRNSKQVSKAKARILAIIRKNQEREKVEWAKVQKNPTTEVLQAFIVANPKSGHVQIAKLQLSALRAAYAQKPIAKRKHKAVRAPAKVPAPVAVSSAPIAQQELVEETESRAFARAKARILSFARRSARADKAAWHKVLKSPSQKSLRAYLYAQPHGVHAAQARLMIKELQVRRARQKADRAAWVKVKKRPTRKALRSYLVTYRDGRFVTAAKKKLAALQSRATKRRAKKKAAVATKARNSSKTY